MWASGKTILYIIWGKKSQLIETDAHTMEVMRVADTDVTTAVM